MERDLKQKARNELMISSTDSDRDGSFLYQECDDNQIVCILNPEPDGMVEKLQCSLN
jgi:hypothetical protein